MYIKSINNVVGYKDLPDGFSAEFNKNKTYIVGANFQNKSTVGSLFNWCLTGTSLIGKEKELVANDRKKVTNVIVDITFVDNYGIEHRLIRDKGKELILILDNKEIKQENLVNFYQDKDKFLVAHNPYYFRTLEPKKQKDLIRNILPSVEPKIAFNLLPKEEQKIIGSPIEQLGSYTNRRNEAIYELEKERERYIGMIEVQEQIALEDEEELLEFSKEKELKELQEKYENISSSFENSNLEDIQRNIANNLLGDELYCEFIKEISKEHKNSNLVDFGKEVLDKSCFLIVMIGMSKKIHLDKVKFCLGDKTIEVSCKDFAKKYEMYARKIEENIFYMVKEIG